MAPAKASQHDRNEPRQGECTGSNASSACQHDKGHPYAGAGADTQDGRIGQGIVEYGLQHQSRGGQGGTAEQGGKGLRKA